MRFLFSFAGIKNLMIMLCASFIILLLDLLGIALIFPFLSFVISPETVLNNQYINDIFGFLGFSSTDDFIVMIGCLLVLLYVLKLLVKTTLNAVRHHINGDITFRLSSHLFEGLLASRYSLFTDKSASELLTIINAQTVQCVLCLEAVILIVNELLFFSVLLSVALYIKPVIAISSLIILFGIGLIVYFLLVKKITLLGKINATVNIIVYKYGFATANSIRDIKIMRLEGNYIEKFKSIWRDYTGNNAKSKTYKGIPADFSEVLIYIGLVLVGLYVFVNGQTFNDLIPVLGVVAMSAVRILPSFNRIVGGYNEYKYYQHSIYLIKDLLQKIKIHRQKITPLQLLFNKSLNISGLSFSYGDKKIIDSISIDMERGCSYAFVGTSGAGKSTLLDVLVGLRKADAGLFSIDGVNFDPFNTDALKRLVGYVPQSVSLIDESIAFNISFEKNYDRDKMKYVISLVRLDEFVSDQQDGLETFLGESGVRVSGGQKQRIGIARALYRDPQIIIFDEATSALDAVTENEVMDEISRLVGNRTLIIVAHRLSTVKNCNAIHLLDKGSIIARGTHQELLESSKQYRDLNIQQGEKSRC